MLLPKFRGGSWDFCVKFLNFSNSSYKDMINWVSIYHGNTSSTYLCIKIYDICNRRNWNMFCMGFLNLSCWNFFHRIKITFTFTVTHKKKHRLNPHPPPQHALILMKFHNFCQNHYSDVLMTTMVSHITYTRLFTQSFIKANTKENNKACGIDSLWGASTSDRWILLVRKRFHLMTTSCD